ncbi:AraC family transcriptional regulator [Bifidobacterium amazonense]|uniref:AraC family transcriptional regulator n=1 Tax=Bifidobacterium amazonense TaxID=2809027 RepID=A0ABS9VYN1_9BIFI|nr:AraC family transcriptional regulator [Bifidobacterium amazonense]MCH9277225.1 AraC family transcriptional regulator [Bifidobacterium amazonense]
MTDDVVAGRVSGMDMLAGYLYREDVDVDAAVTMASPLLVSACGRYRMVTRPEFSTIRQTGRRDHQLLYVNAGTATFWKHDQPHTIAAGSAVVYLPGEPQRYEYRSADGTEVYWAHFSGSETALLLDGLAGTDAGTGLGTGLRTGAEVNAGVDEGTDSGASESMAAGTATGTAAGIVDAGTATGIVDAGTNPEYAQLFNRMIGELQLRRPAFEELVAADLRRLLLLMRRHIAESTDSDGARRRIPPEIQDAVTYFHRHFADDISIEEYARMQGVSVGWFIRGFREAIGMPPLQYVTAIRMGEAKMLLESTDYPIGDIAAMVGYDNALYFSRLFRARFGRPPSQWRRAGSL